MQIHIADTYADMSQKAADDVIQWMQASPNKLLCIASGDTPAGLFKEIVRRVEAGELDISDWKFIGLDEWAGMNGEDEGSCRYHLDRQFFQPLHILEENICFFNGRAADLQNECAAAEDFIGENGGIVVAILGLGMNRHIGMHEPGTPDTRRTHVSNIDSETQKTGQKYFPSPRELTHGLTLGLANLMEAKHIALLANGAHKAAIVKRVLSEAISENLPATLLRDHAHAKIYLDSAAAQFLDTRPV